MAWIKSTKTVQFIVANIRIFLKKDSRKDCFKNCRTWEQVLINH